MYHMAPTAMTSCLLNVRLEKISSVRSKTYPNIDGFILPSNTHDTLPLDHLLIPEVSKTQKEILDSDGFLG
jgi:hypothetical protein